PLLQFACDDTGGAARCTNNTRGDGRFQTQGVTHSQNPFADTDLVGVAEPYKGQSFFIDFDKRKVGVRVATDNLRFHDALVSQLDLYLIGILNNVVVGYDVTVCRDDNTGPRGLCGRL